MKRIRLFIIGFGVVGQGLAELLAEKENLLFNHHALVVTLVGVANQRLEATMTEAVAAGARAATILASGYLEGDRDPPLIQRVASLALSAELWDGLVRQSLR